MSTINVLDSNNVTSFVSEILSYTGNTFNYDLYDEDCPEDGGTHSFVEGTGPIMYETRSGMSPVTGMFVEDGHLVLVVEVNDECLVMSPTYDKYPICQEHKLFKLEKFVK